MCVCVCACVCLTLWLSVGVIYVDVHGPVESAYQHGLVGALGLVRSVDGLGLPVGPVDVLLKQSHGEDVGDVLGQHCRLTTHTHKHTHTHAHTPKHTQY